MVVAHSLMRIADPDWTTLLVVDDFDLLHRDAAGAFDPDPLLQALANLARQDGLYVLTTIRADTYEKHRKVFHPLCYVGSFLEERYLREIYRGRVAAFQGGRDPLSEAFVSSVIELCDGRVGLFLERLDRGLRDLRLAGRATTACEDIRELERARWLRFEADRPELASAILRAVRMRAGQIEGPAQELAQLRDGAMGFLLEDYTSRNVLTINPVVLGTLLDRERWERD